MSSSSVSARTRVPHSRPMTPRFAVVAKTSSPVRRIPFVVLVVSVLALGMIGLLIFNTSMQRTAFVVTSLRDRAAALSLREQSLKVQVLKLQSPSRLAAAAVAAGMVHVSSPSFLSLKTGKVIGVTKPVLVPNAASVYGGRRTGTTGKVSAPAAGTSNSGNTGLRHVASAVRPSPRQTSSTGKSRGSTGKAHSPGASSRRKQ
jgi:cell division protein FtsL